MSKILNKFQKRKELTHGQFRERRPFSRFRWPIVPAEQVYSYRRPRTPCFKKCFSLKPQILKSKRKRNAPEKDFGKLEERTESSNGRALIFEFRHLPSTLKMDLGQEPTVLFSTASVMRQNIFDGGSAYKDRYYVNGALRCLFCIN